MPNDLKILYIAENDIHPWPNNPKRHDLDAIRASVREFGPRKPTDLQKGTGMIICGHGRFEVYKEIGLKKFPVIYHKMTDAKAKAFALVDNQTTINGGWDDSLLDLNLKELKLELPDVDMTKFGFDEPKIEIVEDEVPEVPVEAVTKPGDIYILDGKHRVMCGDSTKKEDMERLMDGKKADMVFTSPPYANQRNYRGNLNLSPEHLSQFFNSLYSNLFVVNLGLSRVDGELNTYWDEYIKTARQNGLKLISWNVWDRSGMGYSIGQITAIFPIEHEFIFVFAKDQIELNLTIENKYAGEVRGCTNRGQDGEMSKRKDTTLRDYRPLGTVIRCGPVQKNEDHPAQFPVELPAEYIKACSSSERLVLDPFGGSGTTLIAASQLGRTAYLMETDPKYCDVCVERYRNAHPSAKVEVQHVEDK
jgi:DNA modification methylase